eukprot:TRINITY_DN9920_c0_g1_i1.p1 TRINITY_DN9920_c0_g1~~TRINITY_DN9920_c0_g1_i1.p1  ORF type:complete len:206 (+),score=14.76 TRINITY_DN9920_c0_g1_i1:188-805(+)
MQRAGDTPSGGLSPDDLMLLEAAVPSVHEAAVDAAFDGLRARATAGGSMSHAPFLDILGFFPSLAVPAAGVVDAGRVERVCTEKGREAFLVRSHYPHHLGAPAHAGGHRGPFPPPPHPGATSSMHPGMMAGGFAGGGAFPSHGAAHVCVGRACGCPAATAAIMHGAFPACKHTVAVRMAQSIGAARPLVVDESAFARRIDPLFAS